MTIKEMEYGQDDKTVILNRKGEARAESPLTDFSAPPPEPSPFCGCAGVVQRQPLSLITLSVNSPMRALVRGVPWKLSENT